MRINDPENRASASPSSEHRAGGLADAAASDEAPHSERVTNERLFVAGAGYVAFEGRSIQLTARECQLLAFFLDNRGLVVSRMEIMKSIWGTEHQCGRRTVDVFVRRLRAKLGSAFQLETLRGTGYRLLA